MKKKVSLWFAVKIAVLWRVCTAALWRSVCVFTKHRDQGVHAVRCSPNTVQNEQNSFEFRIKGL